MTERKEGTRNKEKIFGKEVSVRLDWQLFQNLWRLLFSGKGKGCFAQADRDRLDVWSMAPAKMGNLKRKERKPTNTQGESMKVYTGGGDKGKTSLFSGERVAKHHVRIDAYGDMDELNSLLGVIRALLPQGEVQLDQDFEAMQRNLFIAGAWLATTPDSPAIGHLTPLPTNIAKDLEQRIDTLSEALPPLKAFILPGGEAVAAWAHVSRTVCRRCERKVTLLIDMEKNQDDPQLAAIQVYLNRLSDYLFVAARHLNNVLGQEDILWK